MFYQTKNCEEITLEGFLSLPSVKNLKMNLRIEFRGLNNFFNDFWKFGKFVLKKEEVLLEKRCNSLLDKFGAMNCFKIE